MNCAEFDGIVHDLDRRGTGGLAGGAGPAGGVGPTRANDGPTGDSGAPEGAPVFSEAVLAHAESCSRCARLLTEIEGLNFALHAIAARDAQEQAPVEVEAALLQTFREQAATRNVRATSGWQIGGRLRSYGWYAAVASAAAIVLFAIGLMRGWVGAPPRQPVANPTSANAGASTGSTTAPISPESKGLESGSSVNSQSAQATTTAAEDATAFYALPYADDAASIEGGAVIRVSVPRSALVAWGLPVPGMGGAQPIPADLLVSADGMPQAIRLVSETNE
ncbi:MAG TPA: hypothetical protein VFW94_21590 [Candidatus Acidoferrales bacterium]|nr:hypothetical protein [Candidatus Acidoferrales bacterium]